LVGFYRHSKSPHSSSLLFCHLISSYVNIFLSLSFHFVRKSLSLSLLWPPQRAIRREANYILQRFRGHLFICTHLTGNLSSDTKHQVYWKSAAKNTSVWLFNSRKHVTTTKPFLACLFIYLLFIYKNISW